MPKKKKTRQQKLQTDIRRQSSLNRTSAPMPAQAMQSVEPQATQVERAPGTFSLPEKYLTGKKAKVAPTASSTGTIADINVSQYKYLSRDLFKTIFLTTTIVVAELLIHFVAHI